MRLFKMQRQFLQKADADQDEVDQAALALNTAIQNLKPVDGGSGDGNGEGNGNGSTGGNGNGSGSTGGSGNGSGNAGGNWKYRRQRHRKFGSADRRQLKPVCICGNITPCSGSVRIRIQKKKSGKIILMPKAFGQSE